MSTMAGGMAYSDDVFDAMRSGGEQILSAGRDTANRHGIPVETALLDNVSGSFGDLVADEATRWGAELIVLGTHGRKGLERLLLGSDAELVVRDAPAPVLLVRATPA